MESKYFPLEMPDLDMLLNFWLQKSYCSFLLQTPGTHRTLMGSFVVCAMEAQGVQEALGLLHVHFTATYRHSCWDNGKKRYCTTISAFLYSLMQIKLSC